MLKDIIVNLPVSASRPRVIDFAVSVASTFQTHLFGLAFSYELTVPGSVFGGVQASVIAAARASAEKAAAEAVAYFNEASRLPGFSSNSHMLTASPNDAAEHFAHIARCFDLSIVAQVEPDEWGPEELTIEAALFDSGRPMLVVPYIQKEGLKLDRILVCWDGSRSASRAIADALPFLARAKAIDVLVVGKGREGDRISGADIAQHLARHGLNIDLKRVVAPDSDVANTILSYAADSSADLIVMGGYGHSRLREFVLGGATRGLLQTMTVPTLMSH